MLKFHDCILFGLYSDAKIGPTLQSYCNFSHIDLGKSYWLPEKDMAWLR